MENYNSDNNNLGENPNLDDSGFFADEVEINNTPSKLSSTPGKNILFLTIIGVIAIFFIYNFVFKEEEEEKRQKQIQEIIDKQPVEDSIDPVREGIGSDQIEVGQVLIPNVPEIEEINVIEPQFEQDQIFSNNKGNSSQFDDIKAPLYFPEPDLQTVEIPELRPVNDINRNNNLLPQEDSQNDNKNLSLILPDTFVKRSNKTEPLQPKEFELEYTTDSETLIKKQQIRTGNMMFLSGEGNPTAPVNSNKLDITGVETVKATKIANTDITIAQGKVIDAILETAISTDIEGNVRAVVSRDVYAETGRKILIPKGSRVFGSYGSFDPNVGQKRVGVSWDRIIRPDGIDVNISAISSDALGRAGIGAFVDNKFYEVFSNSILLSLFTIGGAIAVEKISESGGTSSTQSNSGGGVATTQTGNASDFAVLDAVDNLTDTASTIVDSFLDSDATFYVQQGTIIKIIVNQDLVFPSENINVIK